MDAPTPPPESSPRPEAPTSYENSAAPVAPPVTLDASGWLAGFKVAVKGASLDPTAHLMILRVTLTNTSQVDAPLSQNDNEISIDPGEGSGLVPMQSVTPNAVVVAGSTATSTLRFFAPPGISLDKAILVLGKPADPLCLVALNNAADAGSVATSSGS
ncbi:MAG: hypothetical protein L0H96_04460 [Humibacillus sp.]|nr:hypothetical protein [Humibacillus sp.]MDN5776141.1 hypothetical protein [Humibacillus sp.]